MLAATLIIVALIIGGGLILVGAEGMGRLRALYNQGGERHWDLLGVRVGLLHGHDAMGGHALDGQRRGVWVHVEAEGAWMIIRGRIEVPMPDGLRVVHREIGGSGGIKVGSPVLDGLIFAEGAPQTTHLLRDPELAGALLAVVHAWPGSAVDTRHVTLRYPDTLGRQLEERCEEVVMLVEAIRTARDRCCCRW